MNRLLIYGLLVCGLMYGCEQNTTQDEVIIMDQHVKDYKEYQRKECRSMGLTMNGGLGYGVGSGCGGIQPMIDLSTGELTLGFN